MHDGMFCFFNSVMFGIVRKILSLPPFQRKRVFNISLFELVFFMEKEFVKERHSSAVAEPFAKDDFKVASWLVRYIDSH